MIMMKAAKLEWAGAGEEQGRSRPEAGQVQARGRPGAKQEQARRISRAGSELSRVKLGRVESGQKLGRS